MIAYRFQNNKVTEILDLPESTIKKLGLIKYKGVLPIPKYDWVKHDVLLDSNGNFVVVNKSAIEQNEMKLSELREQREHECFPIINRGQLWYSMLTAAQYSELQVWYQAWLDVTETLVVPEKPGWLE